MAKFNELDPRFRKGDSTGDCEITMDDCKHMITENHSGKSIVHGNHYLECICINDRSCANERHPWEKTCHSCERICHPCESEGPVIIITANTSRTIVVPIIKDTILTVHVHRNAHAIIAFYCVGAGQHNVTLTVQLEQEGARADIRGVYVMRESGALEIQTKQIHNARKTQSSLICRGILFDRSCVKYEGAIVVDNGAQHSIASQENKNILRSEQAHAISIPQLEVLTDEVQCAHGSAVGYLDPQALFYLRARGLAREQAERLLLESFLAPAMAVGTSDDQAFAQMRAVVLAEISSLSRV